MANAYSGGNFNLDTSANVADMTTLKGSAPAVTDNIYVYNGARLTCEQSFTCNKIFLGQTSAGAAGAGNRYGKITINSGITVTFQGNATNANSGIQSNPTSADASSKNCEVVMNGTVANPIVFTNSVGALNTNNKYVAVLPYGYVYIRNIVVNYSYSIFLVAMPANSTKSTGCDVSNVLMSPLGAISQAVTIDNVNIDLPLKFRFITLDVSTLSMGTSANYFILGNGTTAFLVAGGSIDWTGCKWILGTGYVAATYMNMCGINPNIGDTYYYGRDSVSFSPDVLPTQIVPTDFTLIDMKDGLVKYTISNIASYTDTDEIVVYDNLNVIRSCVNKARYVANGNYGLIPSLGVGTTLTGWYAKATSDNKIYSEASSVAGTITTGFTPRIISAVPNVVPTAGGTVRLTYEQTDSTAGLIAASITADGVASSSISIISGTVVDVTFGALTAGQKDIVAISTAGTATAYEAITVQAGASAPGPFTIEAFPWGPLQSKIVINPSAGALRYYIYRDENPTAIIILTNSFEHIDTTTAGVHTYQVISENNTGVTASNIETVDVYLGKTISSAWTAFKNQLTNDSALSSYVNTFKFNRHEYNFTNRKDFPLVICYPDDVIKEVVVAMPKRKLASLVINVFGKIYGIKGDDMENALISFDELLKNAIEKDLKLGNTVSELNVSESKLSFLDKEVAEVNFTVEILVKRFTMGIR